jgi:MerR family transcriptional regulator, light-induced transcriptional regulator
MTVREGPIDVPGLGQYSDFPMFNTKAVVQQTGVPAPTLRAWERRYTLLSPERTNHAYRLYSERDIMLIRWLKGRVGEGMSISQAIALFRHQDNERQTAPDRERAAFQVAFEGEGQFVSKPQNRGVDAEPGAESHSYPLAQTMQLAREKLLTCFHLFDEVGASQVMASMLAIYAVEQVCSELITPTLWKVGQLWAEGQLSVPVEHFASNFFRGLIENLFYVTSSPHTGPLALVCSAPGEPHELAPLMLALFMRRSGMRVAYLGQSIETAGLMHVVRKLAPALIGVSLTLPTYLSALIDLGNQLRALPSPRPIFAFGGQVFTHYPHVVTQIPGIYLPGDLTATVGRLLEMLQQRSENKN